MCMSSYLHSPSRPPSLINTVQLETLKGTNINNVLCQLFLILRLGLRFTVTTAKQDEHNIKFIKIYIK